MRPLLVLILVTLFFIAVPRQEHVVERTIIEPADWAAVYGKCDKAFKACTADYPRCEIDRNFCVTWRDEP